MNKIKRSKLRKAIEHISDAREIVDLVSSDESDSLDNLPDGLKDSDRGFQMEDAISVLDDASNTLEDVIDKIREIME